MRRGSCRATVLSKSVVITAPRQLLFLMNIAIKLARTEKRALDKNVAGNVHLACSATDAENERIDHRSNKASGSPVNLIVILIRNIR